MSGLLQITAPHFCAGLIHRDGRVTEAAPILRFMIHWNGKQVADYCRRKGWQWRAATLEDGGRDG